MKSMFTQVRRLLAVIVLLCSAFVGVAGAAQARSARPDAESASHSVKLAAHQSSDSDDHTKKHHPKKHHREHREHHRHHHRHHHKPPYVRD